MARVASELSEEELRSIAGVESGAARTAADLSPDELAAIAEGESEERSALENLAGGVNQGLTTAAGFPVDAVDSAIRSIPALIPDQRLRKPGDALADVTEPDLPKVRVKVSRFLDNLLGGPPVGGAGTFRRGAEALGLPVDFDSGSIPGNVGMVVGETMPFSGGASALAQRGRQATSMFRGTALDRAGTDPGKFLLEESMLAGGSGAARGMAESGGVNDELSLIGVEILGGLGTSSLMDATRQGATFIQGMMEPFSRAGAERAVARRLQITSSDPEAAAIQVLEQPPFDAPFLSGELSQDFGLLALERSLLREGDTGELLAREAEVNEAIRAQIRTMTGKEAPKALVNHIRNSYERQAGLLDQRVRLAVQEAEKSIRELPPVKDADILEAMSSRIYRNKLEEAMKDAREQESANWKQALGGGKVDVSRIKSGFDAIDARTLKGDSPLPNKVRRAIRSLGQDEGAKNVAGKEVYDELSTDAPFEDLDDIEQIQSVRSLILRQKRLNNASPAPDADLNRRLTELDQVVLNELSRQSQDPTTLDRARRFSKRFNDTFTRGKVGEILQMDARGGEAVHPSLTLQAAFDTGNAGRLNFQQLRDAVDTPEAREAMAKFLRINFARSAVGPEGGFDGKAAEKWLSHNQGVMDLFPDLREKFKNAKNKHDILGEAEFAKKQSIEEFERSRAALFIGAEDPVSQLLKVISSDTPNAGMDELMALAAEDTSGAAMEGLKTAFAEAMVRRVSKRTTETDLEKAVTEAKLDTFLESQMRNISKLYGKKGAERAELILQGVRLLTLPEKARKTKIGSDTMENLQGSILLRVIGRVVGVRAATGLSVKGPGQIQQAAIASNLGRRLGDMIFKGMSGDMQRRLLIDAFEDPKLMSTLLMKNLPENTGLIRERLRAHLIAAGIQDDEEEQ